MKKKLLVLAVPALMTSMVITSCGNSGTPSNADSSTTSSSSSSSSQISSNPEPVEYTYGNVESMSGNVYFNFFSFLSHDIPLTLNYQVANEEFELDKLTEYVKFSMNMHLEGSSRGFMDAFGIIGQLFPSLISDFAYQSFIDNNTQSLISDIEFNYNADGLLYVSFLDINQVPSSDPVSYTTTNLGTTVIDVNNLISSLIAGLASQFANGFSLETLQGLEIDLGVIIPLLAALSVSFENSGFNIRLEQAGAALVTEMLADLIDTIMPDMGLGEMLKDPETFNPSSITLNYSGVNHEVNFALNELAVLYSGSQGEYYGDSPIIAFNIKDETTDASNVFSGFDYEEAYENQQDILAKVKPAVDIYDNMLFTTAYQTQITSAIELIESLESDDNYHLISNIASSNALDIRTSGSGVKTFNRYTRGMTQLSNLFTTIGQMGLSIDNVSSWSEAAWMQLSNLIEPLLGHTNYERNQIAPIDGKNILPLGERAEDGQKISDAYNAFIEAKIKNIVTSADPLFNSIENDLKNETITIKKATDYACQLQQLFYASNTFSVSSLSTAYASQLLGTIDNEDVIILAYLYQYIAENFTRSINRLSNTSSFADLKTVYDTYIANLYSVAGDFSALEGIYNADGYSNNFGAMVLLLDCYDIVYCDMEASSAGSWITNRNRMLSGTSSQLYTIVKNEIDTLVGSVEHITTEMNLTTLNGWKTTLEGMYEGYKVIFDGPEGSRASSTKAYYDSIIDAINAQISAAEAEAQL